MLKRTAILLLNVLLLTLTACGGSTDTTDTGGGSSSTPTAESTAAESGSAGEKIPQQNEAPLESETPSGDTTEEGATTPEGGVDLTKVDFQQTKKSLQYVRKDSNKPKGGCKQCTRLFSASEQPRGTKFRPNAKIETRSTQSDSISGKPCG